MIAYEAPGQVLQGPPDLVKKTVVTADQLVPVCKPAIASEFEFMRPGSRSVPLVTYPNDIFLGRVMYDDILARSPHVFSQKLIAGMTSAVLSSVCAGIGMGWLPASLIGDKVRNNELVVIHDPSFPKVDLTVSMLQLRTTNMQDLAPLWASFTDAIAATINNLKTV